MSGTILAGVMGWPVAHSRSPVLHGTWLARHRIRGAYVPLAVRPEKLEQALRALPALGFAGVNLTVPHKEAAAAIVDRLDPVAQRIGSVNMVTVLPDGSLEGRSTDGAGFIASLSQSSAWQPVDGRAITVIGAGGAARAIADALLRAGSARVRIVNRTEERGRALKRDLGTAIELWPWSLRHVALAGVSLVVNTTTLGMIGAPPLPLDLGVLPDRAVVTDIVYAPLETALLAAAKARGNPVVDGLGMLLHQARPAFARWFGVEPVVDEALRRAVLESTDA
jgi:shikimate dehydrogenase